MFQPIPDVYTAPVFHSTHGILIQASPTLAPPTVQAGRDNESSIYTDGVSGVEISEKQANYTRKMNTKPNPKLYIPPPQRK